MELLVIDADTGREVRVDPQDLPRIADLLDSSNSGLVLIGLAATPSYWPQARRRLAELGANTLKARYIDADRDAILLGSRREEAVSLLVKAWSAFLKAVPRSPQPRVKVALNHRVSRRELLRRAPYATLEYTATPLVLSEGCSRLASCRLCLEACPYNALSEKPPEPDLARCAECGFCASYCPNEYLWDPTSPRSSLRSFIEALTSHEPMPALIVTCSKLREKLYEKVDKGDTGRAPGVVIYEVSCIASLPLSRLMYLTYTGVAVFYYCPADERALCPKRRGADRYFETLRKAANVFKLDYKAIETLDEAFSGGKALQAPLRDATREDVVRSLAREDGGVEEGLPFYMVRVSEECTFCGACVSRCPAEALGVEAAEKYRLLFSHAGCIGCGECVLACPENAVQLIGLADAQLLRSGKHVEVASSPTARCQLCGRPIGPESMVRRVKERLEEAFPSSASEAAQLCPECRVKAGLAARNED